MVLTAGDIADPDVTQNADMGHISADTTVGLLLPYLAEHDAGVMVRSAEGKDLGAVTARSVVKALASGVHNPAEVEA